jgi:uncharacterized protein (DUF2225 family)
MGVYKRIEKNSAAAERALRIVVAFRNLGEEKPEEELMGEGY